MLTGWRQRATRPAPPEARVGKEQCTKMFPKRESTDRQQQKTSSPFHGQRSRGSVDSEVCQKEEGAKGVANASTTDNGTHGPLSPPARTAVHTTVQRRQGLATPDHTTPRLVSISNASLKLKRLGWNSAAPLISPGPAPAKRKNYTTHRLVRIQVPVQGPAPQHLSESRLQARHTRATSQQLHVVNLLRLETRPVGQHYHTKQEHLGSARVGRPLTA